MLKVSTDHDVMERSVPGAGKPPGEAGRRPHADEGGSLRQPAAEVGGAGVDASQHGVGGVCSRTCHTCQVYTAAWHAPKYRRPGTLFPTVVIIICVYMALYASHICLPLMCVGGFCGRVGYFSTATQRGGGCKACSHLLIKRTQPWNPCSVCLISDVFYLCWLHL